MQPTDGLRALLAFDAVYAREVRGLRCDAGEPPGYLKSAIDLARKRGDMKYDLYRFMKGRADDWYARC